MKMEKAFFIFSENLQHGNYVLLDTVIFLFVMNEFFWIHQFLKYWTTAGLQTTDIHIVFIIWTLTNKKRNIKSVRL